MLSTSTRLKSMKRSVLRYSLAASLSLTTMLATGTAAYAAEKLTVVTTIPAVYSLVDSLAGDVVEVKTLSNPGASPHGRTLRPSDVKLLKDADLVIQVGPTLESSYQKALTTHVAPEKLLVLEEIHDLNLLEGRSGGIWGDGHHDHDHGHDDHGHDDHADHKDEHGHDDHGHDDHADHKDEHGHDDHGHDDHADHKDEHGHDDHGHDDHADHKDEHGHDDHGHDDHADHKDEHHDHDAHAKEGHDHDAHAEEIIAHLNEKWAGHEKHDAHDGHAHDAHIWLSLANAALMVEAVHDALVKIDHDLEEKLHESQHETLERLAALDQIIENQLADTEGLSYLVFHDAYQYFEKEFNLKPSGAVLLDPERKPGAKRLSELRAFIKENNVKCVFTEPQFQPKLVKVLQEETSLKVGQLDPIGAELEMNKDLYFTLMSDLARNLRKCLLAK